jgi:hypothetical protein
MWSVELAGIDIADETTDYSYDLVGNLAMQVTEWNHIVTEYEYDDMNRLTQTMDYVDSNDNRILDDMSEQTLAQFDYSYLADGNRSQAVETDDLGDVTTITWEYDGLNRLTSETSDSTNDDRDYSDQFTYDLSSNRLSQVHTTLSNVVDTVYFYDANDRLLAQVKDDTTDNTQDSYTEYAYDHTNQTGKTIREGTDNTGNITSSVTYTYDESGRMTKVETDSDGDGSINSTVTYTYVTSNARVTETTSDGTTTSTKTFLIDPQNATGYAKQIEESVDGTLSRTYLIGHTILAQCDAINGLLSFIQDGHGNTRALANAVAAIVQRFTFDAFGTTLTAGNYTTADNAFTSWLNPDGAYSIATGLTNHIERWRRGARFLSLDSFAGSTSDPISLHKYLYANGNPVMGIDPSGLYAKDVHFYFNYYLARYLGLNQATSFTHNGTVYNRAYMIAWMAQRVDDDSTTTPMTKSGVTRSRFHFPESWYSDVTQENDPNVYGYINYYAQIGSLEDFGILLHIYQDTYAHQGFGSSKGHWYTYSPDIPYKHTKRDKRMAESVYNLMSSFASGMGIVTPSGRSFDDFWSRVEKTLFFKSNDEATRVTAWRIFILNDSITHENVLCRYVGSNTVDSWVSAFRTHANKVPVWKDIRPAYSYGGRPYVGNFGLGTF